MINKLKERVTELEVSINELVVKHSQLVGALNEAKVFLEMAIADEKEAKDA